MPKANRYFSSILSKRYTAPQHQRMNIFGWHFLSYRCDKESDWKYSWVLRAVVPTRIAIFSGKWRDFYWMARELIWFDQKYSVNIVKLNFLAGGNNLGRASSRFRPQACSELLMLFSQENCHKNTARPFPTKQNLWQKITKIRLLRVNSKGCLFLTIISVACEILGGLEEQWNPRCLQKYFPFHFYNIFPELAMRLKVPLHHYLRGLWQSWLMQQSWKMKKIWNTKLGEELSYQARTICWHWCRELQIFALFARLNYFPSSLHLHSDFKLEKEFRREVGRRR